MSKVNAVYEELLNLNLLHGGVPMHKGLHKVLKGDAVLGGITEAWIEGYCAHAGLHATAAARVVYKLAAYGSAAEDAAILAEKEAVARCS